MTLHRLAALVLTLAALAGAGCGSPSSDGSGSDPTPERIDGSPSQEFEPDDIERADDASDEVKDYCADAVSEAQRVGCESHVTAEDLP